MAAPRYRFAARARRDLKAVARYSRARWGSDQATRYAETLDAAFARLASFPELGRTREDIEPGVRSFVVGSHLVLYLIEPGGVLILRVVDQRRDLSEIEVR